MMFFLPIAGAIALTALSAPAVALSAGAPAGAIEQPIRPAPVAIDETTMMTAATVLRPGEFRWTDAAAAGGPVLIQVSIADQRLYAWRNGALFAVSTVSTGRPGHATPTGAFPVLEKDRDHRSNRYANAPMPFMQRLTEDGIALHAGKLPGYPASHGCVRLPLAFAARLFAATSRGSLVIITARPLVDPPIDRTPFASDPGQVPLPRVLAPTVTEPRQWVS